ncbi:DUF6252 family protein [Hymenobacter artigasi]|uniref:DUF4402 domain-containing protein n=1 Tax=Hymenobacter artigasi TaxID=2719616 RepID=A0ABX1HN78_9BACT|nr:DUF6252 family protein [Hymenobacter artigasi]NKI91723.1 hypothetical protein [Hymenobacter artigasi]
MISFRTLSYRAATVVALASVSACSSSSAPGADPTPARGLAWTVDGAAMSTTTVQSQTGSNTVSVAGTVTNGSTSNYLSLEMPNAVGTYTFSSTARASATYSTNSGTTNAVYYAGALPSSSGQNTIGAGTIVVTALTATNVTGTFTFTGIGPAGASKSITNGTFNVGL